MKIPYFVPIPITIGTIGTSFGMTLWLVIGEEESSGAQGAPLLSSSPYQKNINVIPKPAYRNASVGRQVRNLLLFVESFTKKIKIAYSTSKKDLTIDKVKFLKQLIDSFSY